MKIQDKKQLILVLTALMFSVVGLVIESRDNNYFWATVCIICIGINVYNLLRALE